MSWEGFDGKRESKWGSTGVEMEHLLCVDASYVFFYVYSSGNPPKVRCCYLCFVDDETEGREN